MVKNYYHKQKRQLKKKQTCPGGKRGQNRDETNPGVVGMTWLLPRRAFSRDKDEAANPLTLPPAAREADGTLNHPWHLLLLHLELSHNLSWRKSDLQSRMRTAGVEAGPGASELGEDDVGFVFLKNGQRRTRH